MKTWEAILEAVKGYPVGHEFSKYGHGFTLWSDLESKFIPAGIVEMVRHLTGRSKMGDENISRRIREFNYENLYDRDGRVFRCENIKDGWWRITENKQAPLELQKESESCTTPQKRVWFEPVEGKGGELHLF